jgi:hypothetical protein
MKARAAFLTLALAACWHAGAAPKHRNIFPPYLTVDMFVAEYRGTPHPSVPGSGSTYVLHHAQGYLAGVADVSQSRTWCLPPNLATDQANDLVVLELAKMLPALAKRPRGAPPPYAGPLLLEQYAAKFPVKGDCAFTPHLTGDEFINQLMGGIEKSGVAKSKTSDHATDKQRYAEGYLAGVIDATQGSSWCAPSRLKPMEVASRMLTELDKRKALGPIHDNAAPVLLELYNATFPCPQP